MPKSFVGIPSRFRKILWYRKFSCIIECVTSCCQNFFVSQWRKSLYANPTVFERISRFETFLRIKNGVSHFSLEKVWSHSAEKCRELPFNFSEKLCSRKNVCVVDGKHHAFPSKIFCLTVPKTSWASLQCFKKIRVSKIFMHIRVVTIFRRKLFVSHCRKFL